MEGAFPVRSEAFLSRAVVVSPSILALEQTGCSVWDNRIRMGLHYFIEKTVFL